MGVKIGILGGSFNPVHNGHVRLAKLYKNALKLDIVLVIPANIPPHKSAENLVSAEDRVNMLNLAFAECDFVKISKIELEMSGKNYTINTLKKLKEVYPNDEFYLIIGGDMFLCFETWREYEQILSICKVCTAPRTKGELELLYDYQNKIDNNKDRTIILDAPVLQISSTEIREKAKSREALKDLVPEKVFEYIIQKDLY